MEARRHEADERKERGTQGTGGRFCKMYRADVQGEALQVPPREEAALDAELRLQLRK